MGFRTCVCVLAAALAVAAQGAGLDGRWTDGKTIFEIEGGRVVAVDGEHRESGVVAIDGRRLTFTFDGDDEEYTFERKGDRLLLTDEDGDTESFRLLAPAGKPKGLAGRYKGVLQQTPTTVTLALAGGKLTGEVDASGYVYELKGTAKDAGGKGTLTDTRTKGTMRFELELKGDELFFTLLIDDPATGKTHEVPLEFLREGAKREAPAEGALDKALIGRWRHTYANAGDGIGVAVDTWLVLNADGTFRYGDAKAAGGGAGVAIRSEGNDAAVGTWKAQNKVLFLKQQGSAQWVALARYHAEGGRMLLTFDNGEKQVWYRQ